MAVSAATAVAGVPWFLKTKTPPSLLPGAPSQHDQIGVAIAVHVAGEDLTALAGQRVVAFKGGYVVGLAEPHHQGRTDGQVASDHGYIEEAIAVEVR